MIYRHQVLKQADVVLGLFLCGDQFTTEEKRVDFEYYDPLTTGDSSLSAIAQAIIANDIGQRDLAEEYFMSALFTDLADTHRNTDQGLHLASLGGIWTATVMGFGGIRDHDGVLTVDPRIPESWGAIDFRLQFRGQWIHFLLSDTAAEITLESTESARCTIEFQGRQVDLYPGKRIRLDFKDGVDRLLR